MKRIIKYSDSEILHGNLKYNSAANRSEIGKILLKEQKNFCAYTEEYIGINDANDIEHFNPNYKNKTEDSYYNWFKVKHKPNNKKRNNWIEPILHPSAEDFEKRVIYYEGFYLHKPEDIASKNLIELLNLNDEIFVNERLKYIGRRKERIAELGISANEYFEERIKKEIWQIRYLRAIQEEFEIDIWNMIPEI